MSHCMLLLLLLLLETAAIHIGTKGQGCGRRGLIIGAKQVLCSASD